jgi:hypothetical protein
LRWVKVGGNDGVDSGTTSKVLEIQLCSAYVHAWRVIARAVRRTFRYFYQYYARRFDSWVTIVSTDPVTVAAKRRRDGDVSEVRFRRHDPGIVDEDIKKPVYVSVTGPWS